MWDDAFPSFLIGLREGLEGGLIVSILVATLVRAGARSRLPQVWTGVLAAIAVAMSFGAVLTFTAASLSATAQEAFGGTLSVIAVAFVTGMVFWMRRSARGLSGEIKEKVTGALGTGAGVLVLTSFLAVGREGLETALFLWTTARAAGESAGPMTGAGIGLLLAAGLCWGLYRRVLKINLTRFFTATGAVLIVIAAGVLGYGLRDLQEGGVLPGRTAYAVDLGGSIDAGSWYSTLVQGVLNLTPTMTWLQVAGYAGYLAVVMTLFVRGVRANTPQPAGPRPDRGTGAAAPASGAGTASAAGQDSVAGPEPVPGAAAAAGHASASEAAVPASGAGSGARSGSESVPGPGSASPDSGARAASGPESAVGAAAESGAGPEGPVSVPGGAAGHAPASAAVQDSVAGAEPVPAGAGAGAAAAAAAAAAEHGPASGAGPDGVPGSGAGSASLSGPESVSGVATASRVDSGAGAASAVGGGDGRGAASGDGAGLGDGGGPKASAEAGRDSGREPGAVGRRRPAWVVPVAVVAVPAVLAGLVVALARPKPAGAQTVAVSGSECGKGFSAPKPGRQTFQMHNTGGKTSEVYLIDPATGAVYGEIEGLAPGTTRDLVATVAGGSYAWRCVPTGGKAVTSKAVSVTGAGAAKPVVPVSESDLAAPLKSYKAYVNQGLATLVTQSRKLDDDIDAGHLDRARADWLTAHRTYASLGAAYGTFEDFDQKIDGRPDGLPNGVRDQDFTGFLRIEYGLWHGQSAKDLRTPARQLAEAVAGLARAFPGQKFDAGDLPLRAHEILENTLQFELTGDTDQGSGTGLATADANLAGTRELLTVLKPLLTSRAPKLLPTVDADVARLQQLLDAAHHDSTWTPVDRLVPADRQRLDGATGQLLEDLAPIPDLLEIRKSA